MTYLKVKLLTLIGAALAIIVGCSDHELDTNTSAAYVGRAQCTQCHAEVVSLYSGSDHDRAMQPVNDTTVLGDFNNVSISFNGVATRFYKNDNRYYVETDDSPTGRRTYEIKYTFGVYPLQQYLVELDNGRIQCLPFCWDSRSEFEGGDHWFHIKGDQLVTPDSLLHWTRIAQNWNLMCAECHSTNLQKNYDPETNSYATTWSEIDVSCETCHGPASEHLIWASDTTANDRTSQLKGFANNLSSLTTRQWLINAETGNATIQQKEASTNEIESCARCHSHRRQVTDQYNYPTPLANTHAISLIQEPLYYIDGQMREEAFVYGSFLQSRMYAHGVICSDCHDPHSLKLKAESTALCGQCHQLIKYDTNEHHKHKPEKVECVDCHMPEHTYMVVDNRRDHSFRIPRPDLSEQLNTPNVCTQCHRDKTSEWATQHFAYWYPERTRQSGIGQLMQSAMQSDPRAFSELQSYIDNQTHPAILRATAIMALSNYPVSSNDTVITHWLNDSSAIVRRAAVELFGAPNLLYDPTLLLPRLGDSIRTVRIAAARVLLSLGSPVLNHTDSISCNHALNEYLYEQRLSSDHPSGRLNLADYYMISGKLDNAGTEIRMAIKQEPLYAPAYVNLADLYRMQGRDSLGIELLEDALTFIQNDATLHFALALAHIRIGHDDVALSHLTRAVELDSSNIRFAYLLAVALLENDKHAEASAVIRGALERNPNSLELLQTALTIARKQNNQDDLNEFRSRLNQIQTEYRAQSN